MSLSESERLKRIVDPDRDHDQKWRFLLRLLSEVPEDSYWSVQGLYHEQSLALLSPFFVQESCCGEWKWGHHFIKLTKEVRAKIIELLDRNDILHDITHFGFCKDGKAYFASYDTLSSNSYSVDFISEELKQFGRNNGIHLSMHQGGNL